MTDSTDAALTETNISSILFPFPDDAASGQTHGAAKPIWEKQLASWTDPFTVPHSRSECAKWAKPYPGAKICVGWKVQWQKMHGNLWLIVTLATPGDIEAAINDALRDAAVASTVAGIVTAFVSGGTAAGEAAYATFISVFEPDLAARIAEKIITVRLENRSAWGQYE